MNDNQDREIKRQEKQTAGQNTAHVAGRVASRYFGGELGGKVYDAASHTKLGQSVEKGVGKRISNTPVVGNLNKELNDTGVVDAADKAVDVASGSKSVGGSAVSGLTGGINSTFKNSSINTETPSALQNKNRGISFSNRFSSKSEDQSTDTSEKSDNDNNNSLVDSDSNEDEQKGSVLLKKIAPLIIAILPILVVIILLVSLMLPILTGYSWFTSLFHHKKNDSADYTIYNKTETEDYQAEKAYNDAIRGSSDGSVKGIVDEYKEKYGVTVDWYLLNALITYRYAGGSGNFYSSDGNQDISEEDINKSLENLENSEGSSETTSESSNTNSGINYTAAKEKIQAFASLMVVNENGSYVTDSEKDGKTYNNILNSKTFSSYYKDMLKNNNVETKKTLLNEIYDYADSAREIYDEEEEKSNTGGNVVSDTSIIHLQTCDFPYKKKSVNGKNIYDNPTASPSSKYPDYLNIKDYLRGVLYREFGISKNNKEGMKAQVILALTFLIRDQYSGFDLKSGEMYFPSGVCRQATCSPTNGCALIKVSKATFYIGEDTNVSGGSVINRFRPMNETELSLADEAIDEVFGKVMVKKGVTAATYSGSNDTISINYCATWSCPSCHKGTCLNQSLADDDARSGMSYDAILKKYFTGVDYDIIDITEGLYTENSTFTDSNYTGAVVYYNQGNYTNSKFCGTSSKNIRKSGCGIVSAAIVASSLTGNKKYDPIYMSDLARTGVDCGSSISGTRESFFPYMAEKFNFNVVTVSKSQTDKVVDALKTGKALVIAHMGYGHFTTGEGHYIVLSAINSKGEVLVYDPGHRANTEKWFSLNSVVADELKGNFFIYTNK